jgi:Cu/Ag efflux protein CusF
VKSFLVLALFVAALASCRTQSSAAKEKHYPFTGKVVSVSSTDQTAAIAGSAIPNYMDAMTMDYPFKSKEDFQKLHAGDQISATFNLDASGAYNLSDVKVIGKK